MGVPTGILIEPSLVWGSRIQGGITDQMVSRGAVNVFTNG